MKKNLITLVTVFLAIFFSVTAKAQQAEEKPKVADLTKISEKERTKPTDPAVADEIAAQKTLSSNDLPKTVVPGGEFKPLATDKAVSTKTNETEKYKPIIPQQSKKAGPPPVVTEQNADPSAEGNTKPAPVKVILQKEQ